MKLIYGLMVFAFLCLLTMFVLEYRDTRANQQRIYQRGYEEGMKTCK
jgi:hypothetical protein